MALSPVRLRASMSVGSADTIAFTRSNSPALIASMKAALLEVVSGMHRSYLRCSRTAGRKACATSIERPAVRELFIASVVVQAFRPVLFAIAAILLAGRAGAQAPAAP